MTSNISPNIMTVAVPLLLFAEIIYVMLFVSLFFPLVIQSIVLEMSIWVLFCLIFPDMVLHVAKNDFELLTDPPPPP